MYNVDLVEINNSYWGGAYVLESLPPAFYSFAADPTSTISRPRLTLAEEVRRDALTSVPDMGPM
jgi:hypothetical protein